MTDAELLDTINKLNLSEVKNYLIGELNWSLETADNVGAKYRRFLFLAGKYGPANIVPWDDTILAFWKAHILHTRKYFEDCKSVFGGYFHYDLFDYLANEAYTPLLYGTITHYLKEYNKNPM